MRGISLYHIPPQVMSFRPDQNTLHNSPSLYLREHASNPVHWHCWSDEVWAHAREVNALVIVSIGYSSCHWCHVMERESFSNPDVAAAMNKHFVCIKVDREEHPQIDQYYMDAVQLMSGHGGWPLNVICLPDKRPIYGGTYFRSAQWMSVLHSITQLRKDDPQRVLDAAEHSVAVMNANSAASQSILYESELPEPERIAEALAKWSTSFDPQFGGDSRVPKFPMPCALRFLLQWSHSDLATAKPRLQLLIRTHVVRSIDAMLQGGIWDQLSGGWARYSTDRRWKLPHFEKMLYDNAQLLSAVAEAYAHAPKPAWKDAIRMCIEFLRDTFRLESGVYGSALDADSEGEEGLYYTWTRAEIERILGSDAEWFCQEYGILPEEELEDGRYVLFPAALRGVGLQEEDANENLDNDSDAFSQRRSHCLHLLRLERAQRVAPAFDDKAICSWNALLVSALIDAAYALNDASYADEAESLLKNIIAMCRTPKGLTRCAVVGRYDHASAPEATADDYVMLAMACLDVYEFTGNARYLDQCEALCDEILRDFGSADEVFISFARVTNATVPSRPETHDTVIPSSSAVFCRVLLQCGTIRGRTDFLDRSRMMLLQQAEQMIDHAPFHAEWLQAYVEWKTPFIIVHLPREHQTQAAALSVQHKTWRVVADEVANAAEAAETVEAAAVQDIARLCDQSRCLISAADQESVLSTLEEMRSSSGKNMG